jgi:hypothetical protein
MLLLQCCNICSAGWQRPFDCWRNVAITLIYRSLENYTFLTPGFTQLRPNDYAVTHELAKLVVMGFSNSTFRPTEYKR